MTETRETIAIEARITGRVQGVWFRAWTQEQAQRLGLTGWVRNEPDGSVRALLAGRRRDVEAMLALCRQGPPMARVEAVQTSPAAPEDAPADFRITG